MKYEITCLVLTNLVYYAVSIKVSLNKYVPLCKKDYRLLNIAGPQVIPTFKVVFWSQCDKRLLYTETYKMPLLTDVVDGI